MEYQDYWRTFERTGSVMDYLHYTACARDELAAGIAEEETAGPGNGPEQEAVSGEYEGGSDTGVGNRVTMRATLASSAMATGLPTTPEYSIIAGIPTALGPSASMGAVLLSGLRQDRDDEKGKDPNP